MLKVSFSDRSLPKSGSLVIPVFADSVLGTAAKELDEASGGYISAVMKRRDFTGTAGSVQVVTKPSGLDYDELVLVGLGKASAVTDMAAEEAGGRLFASLGEIKVTDATLLLEAPDDIAIELTELAARIGFGCALPLRRGPPPLPPGPTTP